jgi:hypothetical protein
LRKEVRELKANVDMEKKNARESKSHVLQVQKELAKSGKALDTEQIDHNTVNKFLFLLFLSFYTHVNYLGGGRPWNFYVGYQNIFHVFE